MKFNKILEDVSLDIKELELPTILGKYDIEYALSQEEKYQIIVKFVSLSSKFSNLTEILKTCGSKFYSLNSLEKEFKDVFEYCTSRSKKYVDYKSISNAISELKHNMINNQNKNKSLSILDKKTAKNPGWDAELFVVRRIINGLPVIEFNINRDKILRSVNNNEIEKYDKDLWK